MKAEINEVVLTFDADDLAEYTKEYTNLLETDGYGLEWEENELEIEDGYLRRSLTAYDMATVDIVDAFHNWLEEEAGSSMGDYFDFNLCRMDKQLTRVETADDRVKVFRIRYVPDSADGGSVLDLAPKVNITEVREKLRLEEVAIAKRTLAGHLNQMIDRYSSMEAAILADLRLMHRNLLVEAENAEAKWRGE